MTNQSRADCMHWVMDQLEDFGSMSAGELLACNRNHDHENRWTNGAIMSALERAVGLALVVEDEHEDARARQGGAPAMYSVAS